MIALRYVLGGVLLLGIAYLPAITSLYSRWNGATCCVTQDACYPKTPEGRLLCEAACFGGDGLHEDCYTADQSHIDSGRASMAFVSLAILACLAVVVLCPDRHEDTPTTRQMAYDLVLGGVLFLCTISLVVTSIIAMDFNTSVRSHSSAYTMRSMSGFVAGFGIVFALFLVAPMALLVYYLVRARRATNYTKIQETPMVHGLIRAPIRR